MLIKQTQTFNDNIVFKSEAMSHNFQCNMTTTKIPDEAFCAISKGKVQITLKLKYYMLFPRISL